ncbi:hypothetical protein AWH48_20210 [Domibacillus aminovorans]|uniref:Uncharacterized protein n=1 Tax=Domibacillus aminovorans TaxID=29332 RepID=A0A177KP49_9BACI|nr:hypothetical protein [Domibacillus aminovorans]OAH55190.1 hypothetical protein AWH48_20210 [Domibacillus aminovorans]
MNYLNRGIFSIMFALLLIAGCSNTDEEVSKVGDESATNDEEVNKTDNEMNTTGEEENVVVEGSYAAIVTINGVNYIAQNIVTNNEFTIKEQIGEIKKKVDIEVVPTEDWNSNVFEEGNKIYTANEKNDIYLIEAREGEYTVLTTRGTYSKENQ